MYFQAYYNSIYYSIYFQTYYKPSWPDTIRPERAFFIHIDKAQRFAVKLACGLKRPAASHARRPARPGG